MTFEASLWRVQNRILVPTNERSLVFIIRGSLYGITASL